MRRRSEGVAAKGDDLFDKAGGSEAKFLAGHDEDGFDTGDLAVGEGDAEFVVEVGEVAEAAEDGGSFAAFDESACVSHGYPALNCGWKNSSAADNSFSFSGASFDACSNASSAFWF